MLTLPLNAPKPDWHYSERVEVSSLRVVADVGQIQVSSTGDVAVLKVIGEVDLSVCPALQRAVDAALVGQPRVVVDLAECTYMDSSGLRVLIGAVGSATKIGRSVVVVNPTETVMKIIELADVAQILLGPDAS